MTQDRLTNVRRVLERRKLDCLLVSSVPNITYLTGFSNFSKDEREALLLITKKGQFLFTDGRYIEAVQKFVKGFEFVLVTSKRPLIQRLREMLKKERIKHLTIEEKNLTYYEYQTILYNYHTTVRGSSYIEEIRQIKETGEIDAIERACKIGDEAFSFLLKKIQEGVTEQQVAFELEIFIKKRGADVSFPPIVAFGENSSIPHHKTSNQRLASSGPPAGKAGQFVLLDFGVKVDNYCSDMTRTVFFGRASNKQKKMYQTVLAAQKKAIEHLGHLTSDGGRAVKTPRGWPPQSNAAGTFDVPNGLPRGGGIKAKTLDHVARSYIVKQGFPTIPHSLGHGIGLEVHELPWLSPRSKDVLKPGMVFSIEPGIYIPGFGGIRIEDLVVLTPSNHHLLTTARKELIEL